jgi:demethylmenaquinone methyltransferase/2-methoxy-6-polyprenyl-1,4-benzoquinol methylase
MPATAELTDYYARRAREYDQIYLKPERQPDLARLRARTCDLLAGRSVYEVACGTGYWTALFASTAARIHATDYNEEVLAIARSRLTSPVVTFAAADAFAPPEPSFPCDAGFAGFWWSHLRHEEIDGFLDGFFARLAPGARFLFIDNAYVEGSSTPLSRTDAAGNTYQQRELASGETHEVLKNFPNEASLRRHLEPRAHRVTWEQFTYYWLVHGELK